MILTPSLLYLGSPPKTATRATEKALLERWRDSHNSIRTRPSPPEEGHSRLWAMPRMVRLDWFTFATMAPPLTWYRRVYTHALLGGGEGLRQSLDFYGEGVTSWPAVLYGMTHPGEIELPNQAGLIFRAPQEAAEALQRNGEGLWSWAMRYFCGSRCPTPGDSPPIGVDALVDCLQLEAGLAEVADVDASMIPRVGATEREMVEAIRAETTDDMRGWVEEADEGLATVLGYDVRSEMPRSDGPVWRS